MLCGIDEAGRGCLAGPLVVAGAILKESVAGLNDSKQLSPKQREAFFEILQSKAEFKIVFCDHTMVDTKGLSACLRYAIETIKAHFSEHEILMDGNCNFGVSGITTMVKADAKVPEVSAASILAKVSRDRYMYNIAPTYPQYEFEKHKGYGSALHVEKIRAFGYCEIHRKSFKLKALSQPSLF
ncbi:ribonuclease HII [Sulfurospirillum multivorans]|uniref:Ribonuclease n=2 Tax=Sulfurospirillum multivorans TaxID=66821 RepID=A0AA86AQP8_SULMK|nr:ribonuclease HII [Sulfurospirillum multivorans]AHJ13948.1 ribonuclease H [Sulfurospirillum multivorans DSM 12446]QEH07436.1 ribonuclease H [Sulfurospirillum multivorans]